MESPSHQARPRGRALAAVPGIVFAMLPNVACPSCWPAYAGLLSSLGLGALLDATWLVPLTVVFLVVAVAVLAFGARRRRGYRPFLAGLAGASVVVAARFLFESEAGAWAGLVILVGASVWNSWPMRRADTCAECSAPTA